MTSLKLRGASQYGSNAASTTSALSAAIVMEMSGGSKSFAELVGATGAGQSALSAALSHCRAKAGRLSTRPAASC
jgi:hypothetical protein